MLLSSESGVEKWHRDSEAIHQRRLGFSLNLSQQPFQGGALAIRICGQPNTIQKITIPHIGDAALFRIADNFEHRALPILGEAPRVAFVGWFTEL